MSPPAEPLPPLYPVGLVLAGRRCLVVGGGTIARRKAEGLVACGAEVVVVAPVVDEALAALPGVVAVERRPYCRNDLEGVRLAIAATDDPAVNRAVFDDGEALGVWVNAADQPDACAFTLPAVLRHGPVVVAVSTGGRSPALARDLRERIAAVVGPDDAARAERIGDERARLHAEGRSTEDVDWTPWLRDAPGGVPPAGAAS